jgi:hypothetical protein
MPTAYGQRLKLRLFLEGVEVPVISANVQVAPNSPIAASIQVLPLAEGTRLLPRTLVHLFFLDDVETKLPGMGVVERPNRRDPTSEQRKREEENEMSLTKYKLLFGGEVVGFVWNKNASQRALILQCMDWSNYWDYAYQFNNTSIFGPGLKAMFWGGSTNLFTDFLETKGNVITKIVASGRCNAFPDLRGLAAGIIRLMEAIGGTYYPNPRAKTKRKKIAGQNIFFSLAELRLHITHMIAAYEHDKTSARLLRRQGWSRLFNRRLGGLGGQTSMRRAINALTGIIFHETYGQPCPYYVPGADGTGTRQARIPLAQSKQHSYIAKGARALQESAQQCIKLLPLAVGETTMGALPGGATQIQSDHTKTEVARRIHQIGNGAWRLSSQARSRGAPERAQALISEGIGALAPITPARIILPVVATTILTPANKGVVESALNAFISAMSALSNVRASGTTKEFPSPPRLNQHIFRPDIWFGAPIRCNVLFPEHYESLTYQRAFLQEPTRFMLKTNDEFFGEHFLFDKFYFAPQTGSVRKEDAKLRDMLRRDVLEHELFTGILPVFEKMGEFNVFAGQKGLSGPQKRQYKKIGFAQRSANFLYFKHRFNARRMTITGKFNPYIACGFPGLIIDKHVDEETIRTHNRLKEAAEIPPQEISQALGTNFLGNFTQVTHVVSQAETLGRTEIVCSYPRQPEESVEFLGVAERSQTVTQQTDGSTRRATDVASLSSPRLNSLGPNKGRIIYVKEVSAKHSAGDQLPLFTGRSPKEGSPMTFVPVNLGVTAVELNSPSVDDLVSDREQPLVFNAYHVVEELARYQVREVDQSMEELIRPGWYGDIWSPGKIGKVYNTFFGTGAITDPQTGIAHIPAESLAAAADEGQLSESTNDPRRDAPEVSALEAGSSIQDAVDFLVLTYSFARQNNMDMDAFSQSYTWRPIATMADIFGTSDLKFSQDGAKVEAGIEGFHSRAFGPYDDLFGLVNPEINNILGIKKDSTAAQKGDTRRRKQERVQQYISAIAFSRAILG